VRILSTTLSSNDQDTLSSFLTLSF